MKKTPNCILSSVLILVLLFSVFPCSVFAADALGEVKAAAVLLVDTQYETVLYEKNSNERRPPASITKVMTALLVLEALDRGELKEDSIVTATGSATVDITEDSSTQNIQAGEQMSVSNLLYCLLCPSANEAANILAEAVSGTIPAFVEAMNARAAELGMTNTHFMNPHGLHQNEHYSTAHDIYLMVREAMKHPLFQKIVSTETYTVPATNLSPERKLVNTNALLSARKYPGYTYKPVTGVKTGHTPEAGFCLVSAAREKERALLAVVLGAENVTNPDGSISRLQFSESKRLLKWGFSAFKPQTILDKDTILREVPVSNGKGVSHVVGIPSAGIEAILPVSYDPKNLITDITLKQERVAAPVVQGQVLGSVTLTYEGSNYGTVDLIAANDVQFSFIRMIFTSIQALFTSLLLKVAAAAFLAVIVLRYLRALRRTPRRKSNANIKHIDSAKGSSDKPKPKPKTPTKPPR